MQIPEELKKMLGRLDCNAEYLIDSPEALVRRAIRVSSATERRTAKAFLEELLNNDPSFQDLMRVWFCGPIEIVFKDEAYLRNFFKLMRDEL